MGKRVENIFFKQDVVTVAQELLGKTLVRKYKTGEVKRYEIVETEAYRGEEDLACHASKGRTDRTKVMYKEGGCIYVYLIYGMYWMLNFVTGKEEEPQAVLIRGLKECAGPGRIGKLLELDKSFYGEDLSTSTRLWLENSLVILKSDDISTKSRVGVDYAGDFWKKIEWRFLKK